jgi:hypothetical protein
MRYSEIILEADYSTSIKEHQLVAYCKKNFQEYFNIFEAPAIYRGASGETARLVNPTVYNRISAHTTNEYTSLVSNLPNWLEYPKRSKSIICTSDPFNADDYGDSVYVVVLPPRFNAGVCFKNDFWFSFPYLQKQTTIYMMEQFNNYFADLVHRAAGYGEGWHADAYTDLGDIKSYCEDIQDTLLNEVMKYKNDLSRSELSNNALAIHFMVKIEQFGDDPPDGFVFSLLADLLDPTKNKFTRITNYNELHSYVGRNREIWTDSPALLVPMSQYDELRDQVLRA